MPSAQVSAKLFNFGKTDQSPLEYMTMPALYIKHTQKIGTLAFPLILTNFAYVGIATIDLIMLGMLSPLDLAAGGLAIALFNQLRTMGTGLATATSNLVARASGRDNQEEIAKLLNASFIWSTLIGGLFALLMSLMEKPLILLGQDAKVAERATQYLTIVAAGMLPCLWFQSIRHFSVGLKTPGPLLAITIISVILTALLNYALIFGVWFFPRLGFSGIAVSTTIVLFISFIMFMMVVIRHPLLGRYVTWKIWQTDKQSLHETWKLGLPVAATYGSEAGFFTVLMLLVGALGVTELAAHTVVNQVVYIAFMIAAGISTATSVTISEAHAKGNTGLVRQLGIAGMGLAVGIMGAIAIPYLIAPEWILFPFLSADESNNSQILSLAISILAIAAFLQIFDASQNIGLGILRGIGDAKSPFHLSILGYWLIGLPAAWILSHPLNLSIQGIWYGLMLGLAVTGTSQFALFLVKANRLEIITSPRLFSD